MSVHTVATSGYREFAKGLVRLKNQVEILIHLFIDLHSHIKLVCMTLAILSVQCSILFHAHPYLAHMQTVPLCVSQDTLLFSLYRASIGGGLVL